MKIFHTYKILLQHPTFVEIKTYLDIFMLFSFILWFFIKKLKKEKKEFYQLLHIKNELSRKNGSFKKI